MIKKHEPKMATNTYLSIVESKKNKIREQAEQK